MNKLEFLHWLQDYESSLGMWKVNIINEEFSQYTVGCFKDYTTGEYKVYKNTMTWNLWKNKIDNDYGYAKMMVGSG